MIEIESSKSISQSLKHTKTIVHCNTPWVFIALDLHPQET